MRSDNDNCSIGSFNKQLCVKAAKKGFKMSKFDEIALQMEKNAIVKCVIGNYIIYRKDYLQDNLEKEIILQKSAREFARKFKGLKNKKRGKNKL